jgi:hypothetical protein
MRTNMTIIAVITVAVVLSFWAGSEEYSQYKRPFPKSIRVSPGHQTAVERSSTLPSTRCRAEFGRSSRGIDACRRDSPANLTVRPTATLPLPPGLQPIVVVGMGNRSVGGGCTVTSGLFQWRAFSGAIPLTRFGGIST